jgi:hypothetical protein
MKKTGEKNEELGNPTIDLTPNETQHVIQRGVDELGEEEKDALFGLGLRAIINDALGRITNTYRCRQKQGKAKKQKRREANENCSPHTLSRKSSNK